MWQCWKNAPWRTCWRFAPEKRSAKFRWLVREMAFAKLRKDQKKYEMDKLNRT